MKTILISSVGCMAFLLGGCLSSVLPDAAPADAVYRLSVEGEPVTPHAGAVVMRIDRPTVPKELVGQGIVVSPDGQRMATAARASWAEPIPFIIQHSFFDVLSTRHKIVGVLPTSGARTSHRAHLTIRNFEAQFDQGPERAPLIVVQYTATVADASTRDLIGTYTVKKTARAKTISVSSIVQAQNQANVAALNELADWIESLAIS